MADTEIAPTEFQITTHINFEARDVLTSLEPLETIDLIEELDDEMDQFEATILLARLFHRLSKEAPTELLAMTDEQLEARLRVDDAEVSK